jgi:hypothetical protein
MLDYDKATVVKMGDNAPAWEEMESWILANCEGEMEIMPTEMFGTRAYFEFAEDATIFALRWLRDRN